MMHIKVVKNHNELAFKTWVSYWSNKLSIPIPFSDGSITKFSIVPHSNVLQVTLDYFRSTTSHVFGHMLFSIYDT